MRCLFDLSPLSPLSLLSLFSLSSLSPPSLLPLSSLSPLSLLSLLSLSSLSPPSLLSLSSLSPLSLLSLYDMFCSDRRCYIYYCTIVLYLAFLFLHNRKARKVVEKIVVPVLAAAGVKYTTVATQYRGFATDHVEALGEMGHIGRYMCGEKEIERERRTVTLSCEALSCALPTSLYISDCMHTYLYVWVYKDFFPLFANVFTGKIAALDVALMFPTFSLSPSLSLSLSLSLSASIRRSSLDLSATNGVVVCGGDGMVSEVRMISIYVQGCLNECVDRHGFLCFRGPCSGSPLTPLFFLVLSFF